MRAVWNGTLSFGLVSVPISLYPAIRKELMRKYPRHAWPEDTTIAVSPKGRGGR